MDSLPSLSSSVTNINHPPPPSRPPPSPPSQHLIQHRKSRRFFTRPSPPISTADISGAIDTTQNTFQQKLQRLKHRISTKFKKANPTGIATDTASKLSHKQLPPLPPNS